MKFIMHKVSECCGDIKSKYIDASKTDEAKFNGWFFSAEEAVENFPEIDYEKDRICFERTIRGLLETIDILRQRESRMASFNIRSVSEQNTIVDLIDKLHGITERWGHF